MVCQMRTGFLKLQSKFMQRHKHWRQAYFKFFDGHSIERAIAPTNDGSV